MTDDDDDNKVTLPEEWEGDSVEFTVEVIGITCIALLLAAVCGVIVGMLL